MDRQFASASLVQPEDDDWYRLLESSSDDETHPKRAVTAVCPPRSTQGPLGHDTHQGVFTPRNAPDDGVRSRL